MSASHGNTTNKLIQTLIVIIAIAIIYEFLPAAKNIIPASYSFEKSIAEMITGVKQSNSDSDANEADKLNENLLKDYKVVKIVDGDTIDVAKQGSDEVVIRVRLLGINTPESVDPRRTVECFGKEATSYISGIADDKLVYLETDSTQDTYDKYDRLLAYVYLADGQMVNRKMIADGYAYEYTYDKPYKYQKDFKEVESFAKRESRGLWAANTCNGQK